ncbi:hypothetical protein D7X30_03800 [Corallococcus sp. AB011P]|nr:hypothetical protein D7X30_03800 [Corallococcus sp. AB011P]
MLPSSRGGFVLLYKRQEAGQFGLPRVDAKAKAVTVGATQLAMLLDGLDVAEVKRPAAWLRLPCAREAWSDSRWPPQWRGFARCWAGTICCFHQDAQQDVAGVAVAPAQAGGELEGPPIGELPVVRIRVVCLGDQKWPQFGAWSEDAVEPREVCPRRRHQGRHTS